jgi:hypothetical protein
LRFRAPLSGSGATMVHLQGFDDVTARSLEVIRQNLSTALNGLVRVISVGYTNPRRRRGHKLGEPLSANGRGGVRVAATLCLDKRRKHPCR